MRLRQMTTALSIALILTACGGTTAEPPVAVNTTAPAAVTQAAPQPTATTPPTTGVTLKQVQFAKGIQDQKPVEPGNEFRPDQPVYLALDISGRPKSGILAATFFWHEQQIVSATLDLADTNGGVLFSVGQDTFAHFSFTHTDPLPISGAYRAELRYNNEQLGSYPFAVIPPADALPAKLLEATLARGADDQYNPIDPTTEFGPTDQVVLAGKADLGLRSWVEAQWYVDGKVVDAGTRTYTMEENKAATPFTFIFLPEGGWPQGKHEVVLSINDQEAGRYSFTIANQ